MEFNPGNLVVRLCMQGVSLEEEGKHREAADYFHEAWNAAQNDFEKFIAAYYLARQQTDPVDRLKWHETALKFACNIDDEAARGALPAIYSNIAKCYHELGDPDQEKKYDDLALTAVGQPTDKGPFYHGTRADLKVGDLLNAGRISNYQPNLVMNHIYFTAGLTGAGLAAALARGDGAERVYIVEPSGDFEDDPNVTNKKFPGNPTRSYRTRHPLKIVGEVTDWQRQTPEQIQQWREKLAANNGQIIN